MTISVGSHVEFADAASGRTDAFTLVDPNEGAPSEGRLSVASPVARALLGHEPGDTITVALPHGARRLQVLSVA
jgi:transcription elongation factor GreA